MTDGHSGLRWRRDMMQCNHQCEAGGHEVWALSWPSHSH